MPLVSDRQSKPLSHSNSRAIGFWMSVEGRAPIQTVRVLVSYEALSDLDPTNVRDLHGALENFDRFRSQVETAASRKFDRYGFDAQNYEGMPAIRLTTHELIIARAASANENGLNTCGAEAVPRTRRSSEGVAEAASLGGRSSSRFSSEISETAFAVVFCLRFQI